MRHHRSPTPSGRALLVVAAAALAAASGCTSASGDAAPEPLPATATPARPTTTTTVPRVTTTVAPEPACVAAREMAAPGPEVTPAALSRALEAGVADRRFSGVVLGASVWIEGYGEVVAHNADTPLLPASNQKLLTALGALMLLPHDTTFRTEVRVNDAVVDGVLDGDLALVGGGDPTLARSGANSLDALARQVRDAGIRHVTGSVVADESRQERARTAAGWQDWQIPTYAGPLSALTVDDNRFRSDPEYLAEPAVGNGEAFVAALRHQGVTVDGSVVAGVAPIESTPVASSTSAPIDQLVAEMLLRSDNETAEMLVREIGGQGGGTATTARGVRAVEVALEDALCVDLEGRSGDGSGLSREDFRSARELRTILQAALASPWGEGLDASLPVGGRTGTLAKRFGGTAAAGNLRAKTGSIIGGRALTGHLRTAGGREAVFSVLVNGEGSPAAQAAIDDLIVTLATDPS